MLLPSIVFSASFDCAKASSSLEKTICSDTQLGELDEDLSEYYFKLKEKLDSDASMALLETQRKWLKQRLKQCGANNLTCLRSLYKERVLALRKQYHNVIPYTFSKLNTPQIKSDVCGFSSGVISDNSSIYAAGGHKGREIDYSIDTSGNQASQFEVIVNSPTKPVALMLGAYGTSIWNIAWTQGTKIEAVFVTGYHRQAVAGLPKETPILNSTYDNKGKCGYLYVTKDHLRKINPMSKNVFDRTVDLVYYATEGNIVIGDPINSENELFTSKDTPPEALYDRSVPKAGEAGLEELLSKGLIRRATTSDLERWAKLNYEMRKGELPPVASGDGYKSFIPRYTRLGKAYVILSQITIPAGLFGGNSATFFLEEGVPYPKGKLGHSALFDFNKLKCDGTQMFCGTHGDLRQIVK